MLIAEMILVALQSVRANLFRAFLTMLGIIIGVASVITMIAIGSGAKAAVDQQIDALGASVLSIRAGSFMRMGVAQSGAILTIKDARAVAAGAPSITGVVPEIGGQLQIKLGTRNESLRVAGVSANFPAIQGYTISSGHSFARSDDASRHTVAVLGASVAAKLGDVFPAALESGNSVDEIARFFFRLLERVDRDQAGPAESGIVHLAPV